MAHFGCWNRLPATSGAQVEDDTLQRFAPKFTYHAFGTDETIEGYEGLSVSVCFNGFDFSAWLDVRFEEKQAGYVHARRTAVAEVYRRHKAHRCVS